MVSEESKILSLINEHRTRKKYIDPELSNVGWLKKYIKEEVNSVKSNFKNKDGFEFFDDNNIKAGDRFVDYVLLDEDNTVLAIIESKRFSKDEKIGRIQARTYAKDIEKQVGYKIPIFLTNGHVWCFIDEDGIERKVSGPFSQEDLERRCDLFSKKRDPKDIKVDNKIVNYPRNFQIVSQLGEYFSKVHKSALIEMATGTGKTRVAMAIIKVLINSNMVRNVLFVADRIALSNQAKENGFKQFFSEPVVDLRDEFSLTGRLYVSTIQTLMGGDPKSFKKFSPGFFDLIIFDEAHRSIYDRNNEIHRYFDAIKIGLTATPRKHEAKNTYELFGCQNEKPTVEYSFDAAVLDKVLVPYKAEIIETKVLSLGIKGKELTKDLKDQLRRQEKMPETSEFKGSQFDKVFMDDKTNELIIREFMNRCYKSDEGKPCKSIFFCASQKHAQNMKNIFGKLFPSMSNDVQVIISEMSRSDDEVVRFQRESEPRIALSVGMLDTGVDIPEACNLVFVKPVFSHIRFWQMIGRGTRSLKACKHPEWLPNREKNDFLILDFKIGDHSNIKYHEFTIAQEKSPSDNVIKSIFRNRVKLLKKSLNKKQKSIISKKIIYSIDSLDKRSFIVREKMPTIKKIKSNPFNLEKYIGELDKEVSDLMILNQSSSPNISSFILQTEKLFGLILDKKVDKIDIIRQYVQGMCENILQKDNLNIIKENKNKIMKVLQEDFWENITFEDVEFIIKELSPLMRYFEPNPRKVIQIDAPDLVLSREKFEKEIKEDIELKKFLEKNPLINKIKRGDGINSYELLELEKELSALRPELTIESIQRYQKRDFLLFLREIIGLTYEYDPKELIEQRFDKFIMTNHFNSKQIEFLRLMKKVFADRKHIDIADLAKHPFDEEQPLEYFKIEELKLIVNKCNRIKMK